MVFNRVRGSRCPYCSGRLPITGVNDLPTTDPAVADQWHPSANASYDPQMFSRGSSFKAWWLCAVGHEWQAAIYDRVRGSGCPMCQRSRTYKEHGVSRS